MMSEIDEIILKKKPNYKLLLLEAVLPATELWRVLSFLHL